MNEVDGMLRGAVRAFEDNFREWRQNPGAVPLSSLLGWNLVAAIAEEMSRKSPGKELAEVPECLARLYLAAPSEGRQHITNSVVEHLFELDLGHLLESWEDDPMLAEALKEGKAWGEYIAACRDVLERVASECESIWANSDVAAPDRAEPFLGSDTITLEWHTGGPQGARSLTLEPSDELAASVSRRREFSEHELQEAARACIRTEKWSWADGEATVSVPDPSGGDAEDPVT